jgi:lysophospholipase L1-like esterase
MRLVLVTDSHGRGLAVELVAQRIGRKLSAIRGLYRRRLRVLQRFQPDVVVMHLGHNDLVAHTSYNPRPLFITAVMHQIMEFVTEITVTLPHTRIIVSSVLPRVNSSEFDAEKTVKYNRIARRFGEMVRSAGNKPDANFIGTINRGFWGRIARCEVLPNNHLSDGLHLSENGKALLIRGWVALLASSGL